MARALSFIALISILTGCGLFSKNDPQVAFDGAAGLCDANTLAQREVFKSTLHPVLQKSCYECHNNSSPKAPSAFADDSPSIAYEFAKRFVSLSSPATSTFIQRMQQGHNCGGSCAQYASDFESQIIAWRTQLGGGSNIELGSCSGSDKDDSKVIKTAQKTISSGISGSTLLTFDLNEATPPIPGAIFQVTVRPYTSPSPSDPGTYLIENPILAITPQTGDPNQSVRISNIHILYADSENQLYRNWVSTDFIVQPRKFAYTGGPVTGWYSVNDSPQLANWSAAEETLSFSFKIGVTNLLWTIPTNDPFACKNANTFANFTAMYNGFKNICLNCHDIGGPGYSRFPQKPSGDQDVCREFKKRANLTTPAESLFVLFPQSVAHPVQVNFTTTDLTRINTWVTSERP